MRELRCFRSKRGMVRPANLVISGGVVHGDSAREVFFKSQSGFPLLWSIRRIGHGWGYLFHGRISLYIAAPRVGLLLES